MVLTIEREYRCFWSKSLLSEKMIVIGVLCKYGQDIVFEKNVNNIRIFLYIWIEESKTSCLILKYWEDTCIMEGKFVVEKEKLKCSYLLKIQKNILKI